MFDRTVTSAEYQYLSLSRAQLVRQLLIEALQDHVPPGYTLSTDPKLMFGNALLALLPEHATLGTKMIDEWSTETPRSSIISSMCR